MSVDKSKKSNIKCEHCRFYDKGYCSLSKQDKHYWNRCKDFSWKENKQ